MPNTGLCRISARTQRQPVPRSVGVRHNPEHSSRPTSLPAGLCTIGLRLADASCDMVRSGRTHGCPPSVDDRFVATQFSGVAFVVPDRRPIMPNRRALKKAKVCANSKEARRIRHNPVFGITTNELNPPLRVLQL